MLRQQRPWLYWLLGIAQAVHSAEECWNHFPEWFPIGTGFLHRLTGFFPVLNMDERVFVAANIAIVAFLLALSPFVFLNRRWAVNAAGVIAAIEILNGLGHVAAAVLMGRYFPGAVSGIGLAVIGVGLMLSYSSAALPWRLMKIGQYMHRLMYAAGLGPLVGRVVLLLTTTGRKTGRPRVTPLQYEEIDGVIYVGAARGRQADWYRNIVADQRVSVRVKSRHFSGRAELITDPARVADFLAFRLQRHPRMIGAMLRSHGLPPKPSRADLEKLAPQLAVVAIQPERESSA